jgi:hypothetical protein
MQRDAVDRLDLNRLLLEPELLESVVPDVHLVGRLLSLNRVMPASSKASARAVVARVVAEIEQRVAERTRAAVSGALNRAARTQRPKLRDIDWNHTIAANLKHYLPEHRTVVPERLVGYRRRQQAVARDVVVAIDQSGSMAASVVYAGVFGSVLASMRTLRTSVVVFDTEVVDVTENLDDPVDVLFGTQLGGGTDINRAIAYSQQLTTRPADSLFHPHQGPVRGRRPGGDAAPDRGDEDLGRPDRAAARAVRLGHAVLRPHQRGRRWPSWASRRSPAPPDAFRTCSRSP